LPYGKKPANNECFTGKKPIIDGHEVCPDPKADLAVIRNKSAKNPTSPMTQATHSPQLSQNLDSASIPYGRQNVSASDIEAVVRVLRSDWLTQGPTTPAFERAVADRCGARHAVAANSATSALHLACMALGLGPGDTLWTSPITFVASANCALYCGAGVDFVDIEPDTGLMCPVALQRKLRAARTTGTLPKIVIPVHLCGQPCDMTILGALANEFGFQIVEDAAHALGAGTGVDMIGACRHSAITVFSFHPVKIVTCGEGGVATSNDSALAERMALLRTHGITRNPQAMNTPPEGDWSYEQIGLGFNYRLSDIHAALGLSQMSRLDVFLERRRALAMRYDTLLAELPVIPLAQRPDRQSAWHLYVVRLRPGLSVSRNEVMQRLRAQGIGVNLHYRPVYENTWYRTMGLPRETCPNADQYGRDALTLPLYPDMTEAQQDHVVAALKEVL
jgi:UDP-4-amino-4,6-dideoxy-N-acetyl-beta-L-altrosamine transaminase